MTVRLTTAVCALLLLALTAVGALAAEPRGHVEPRKSAAARGERPVSEASSSERVLWGAGLVTVTSEGDDRTDARCPSATDCTLREALKSQAPVVTFGRGVEHVVLTGEISVLHSVAIVGRPRRRVQVAAGAARLQNLFIIDASDVAVSFTSFDLEGARTLIRIDQEANVKLTVVDMTFDHATFGIGDLDGRSTGCSIDVLKSRFLSGITECAVEVAGVGETLFVKGCYFGAIPNALDVVSNGQFITVVQSLLEPSDRGILLFSGSNAGVAAPSTVVLDHVTVRGTTASIVPRSNDEYVVRVTGSLLEAGSGSAIFFDGRNALVEVSQTCYDGVSFAGDPDANTFCSFGSIDTSREGSSALCGLKAGPSLFYKAKLEKVAAEQSEQGRTAAVARGGSSNSSVTSSDANEDA